MTEQLPISMARKIVGARIAAGIIGDTRSRILRRTFAHRDAPELCATLKRVRETGEEATLKNGMLLGLLGAGIVVLVLTVAIGLFPTVRGLVQRHMEARTGWAR